MGARSSIAVLALSVAFSARAETAPDLAPEPLEEGLRLSILTPRDRSEVGDRDSRLFIAGRALSFAGAHELFDLVVMIDTSRSTAAPAGADVDGDGWVGSGSQGRWIEGTSDDWGDTVLAAQIYATRALLSQLDSRTTRVGIVTFAGDDDPGTVDAIRLAPLTHDFTHLAEVLDYLLVQRPAGHTNIAEGIRVAAEEVLGEGRSKARPEVTRVLLLMTDGQPTRPYIHREDNDTYTLHMGREVARRGVRIDPFPIGETANEDVTVMQTLAEQSGGRLTPVLQPADLLATFENLRLAYLAEVQVVNVTSGRAADSISVQGDGSFTALLPVQTGDNLVQIRAWDTMGRETARFLSVRRMTNGRPPALSPRLARSHTRVLETRLLELLRENLEIEREARGAQRDRQVDVEVEPGR